LLVASGVALLAQLLSFYFRATALARANAAPSIELDKSVELDSSIDNELDDELHACPSCGHANLIKLDDTARLMGGLSELTPVTAWCAPLRCAQRLRRRPRPIPVGQEHGTSLRQSLSGEDQEALEEPSEHDG